MKPDRYRSFAELAANEREGIDFQIRSHRRSPEIAVIAPHGGKIEEHTSEIAEAIAGEQFSFYAFEGVRRSRNQDLHLTSAHFDEPEYLAVLAAAHVVVAVHGVPEAKVELVGVGGGIPELNEHIIEALCEAGFDARPSGAGGFSGVRLEISRALRERLQDGTSTLDEFTAAVRSILMAEASISRRPSA